MNYIFMIPGSKGIPYLYYEGGGSWGSFGPAALIMGSSAVSAELGGAVASAVGTAGRVILVPYKL